MFRSEACAKEDSVLAFLAGQLDRAQAAQVEAHVDGCASCRRRVEGDRIGRSGPDGATRVADGSRSPLATLRFGTAEAVLESLRTVADDEYLVGQELARGGMGRVLEAVDRHGRRVAIKVLLRTTDEMTLRFVREMQISARLQHPSTVTLYEAGRWRSGEPFFSMKLVEGRSLLDALTETTRLEDRLALLPRMLAVADALAYAHERGIIHRDLKPANVLLGDFGETVVIDWGLARLANADPEGVLDPLAGGMDARLTQHGGALGTPAYMPPEQARGAPLDQRADVYSLGALLYHLLARIPPYEAPTIRQLLDQVLEGPPVPLRNRAPDVPPELAAIVQKCMAPDRGQRYDGAREVADDLRRFTTGRLVSAHAYTPRALISRWVRRHRVALTATAAFLLALAGIGAASVWRVVQERNRAEQAQAVATLQRDSAEELVGYLIGEFKNRVRSADRLDLLAGVGDEVARYYRRTVRPTGLETGLQDGASLRRRAAALETLALVEHDRKNVAPALALYREAIELRRLASAQPDPTDLRFLAENWNRIGILENEQGRGDGALVAHRRALALAGQASRGDPAGVEPALLVGLSLERIANTLLFRKSDARGALTALQDGIGRLSPLLARHPREARVIVRLASLHGMAQYAELQLGQVGRAITSLNAASDLYKRALEIDPKNAAWARRRSGLFRSLASLEVSRGRLKEARAALKVNIDAYEEIARKDPQSRATQRDLGWAHADACDLERRAGRLDEAAIACDRSVAIFEEHVKHDPGSGESTDALINGLVERGRVWHAQGQPGRAHGLLARAHELARGLVARDPKVERWHEDVAFVAIALVPAELALGRGAKAETHVREALAIAERQAAAAPEDAAVATTLGRLRILAGDVQRDLQRPQQAELAYRAAETLFERQAARSPEIVFFPVYRAESSLKLGEASRVARALAVVDRLRAEGRLFPEDERKLAGLTTLTARR
jgi:tetratricopeptide (TPR) repeat protein